MIGRQKRHVDLSEVMWIAVDWGTSQFRAFAVDQHGNILDKVDSNQGMSALESEDYEVTLLTHISPWLDHSRSLKVVCCGMVGSRQGRVESPYRKVPCVPVSRQHLTSVATDDTRIEVFIIPGIEQNSPADVMRGEETQIAGYLAKNKSFEGVICLPGTHCKWAKISNGEIQWFRSYMTGELFSLLSTHSVLKHTISDEGWNDADFKLGAQEALKAPTSVIAKLFGIRAKHLANQISPVSARSFLSGLLIGQEIESSADVWKNNPVVIIGGDDLAQNYCTALLLAGSSAEIYDVNLATLSGLNQAFK